VGVSYIVFLFSMGSVEKNISESLKKTNPQIDVCCPCNWHQL